MAVRRLSAGSGASVQQLSPCWDVQEKGQGIQKAKDMKLINGYLSGLWVKKQVLEKEKGTSIQSTLELPHL